jgi:lysozyme
MRKINMQGLELVKAFEEFSPVPYADVAGHLTIGYGHLIKEGEKWQHIDELQAEKLLRHDLRVAEYAVQRFIHVVLTDNQFSALVSFTFNLGAGALQRSTLRQKINRNEHQDVPNEMLKWVFSGGKRWHGLWRRRKAESVLYCSKT